MLNFIIFKYSYQLILCCLTFTPEFFYLSPLGMCLFFLLQRLRTRIRSFIGCLLLLISFYYPLIYPVTYGFIQCNTYTSVRTLLLSDLKYDLSRIVIFLELISYLLRSFIGFPYVCLLFVIEIYNLITFFKPPSEEKDLKTMLESVKYLLKEYVALSKEYRAIFGTVKFNNRIFEEHQYSDSEFSNEFCNLEKQPDIKKHNPNEDSLIVFDLFTPLILVNIDNVYSFYALGALLLPTYTMSKMIYFVVFFYLLDLILLSLFLIPFCKMNFGNGSVYLRIMMLTTMYYLYKI